MTLRQKCFAEALGTFCLVFSGTGAVTVNDVSQGGVTGVGIGLVFGLIVLAMVYTFGSVSGAHFNPAVTVGFYAAGRHPGVEVVPYILAQLGGAVTASVVLRLLFWHASTTLGLTMPAGPLFQSFALEFILTFILMFVILSVATGDRAEGIMAGVAIGATIGLEAIFAGPICGASMNPARSLAPALVTGAFAHQWIYSVAPVLGSLVAARCFKYLHPQGRQPFDLTNNLTNT